MNAFSRRGCVWLMCVPPSLSFFLFLSPLLLCCVPRRPTFQFKKQWAPYPNHKPLAAPSGSGDQGTRSHARQGDTKKQVKKAEGPTSNVYMLSCCCLLSASRAAKGDGQKERKGGKAACTALFAHAKPTNIPLLPPSPSASTPRLRLHPYHHHGRAFYRYDF